MSVVVDDRIDQAADGTGGLAGKASSFLNREKRRHERVGDWCQQPTTGTDERNPFSTVCRQPSLAPSRHMPRRFQGGFRTPDEMTSAARRAMPPVGCGTLPDVSNGSG